MRRGGGRTDDAVRRLRVIVILVVIGVAGALIAAKVDVGDAIRR